MASTFSFANMDNEAKPENMTVGELRQWLKRFEKKQQDHFQKGQIRRRSPTKSTKPIDTTIVARHWTVKERISGLNKPIKQGDEDQENTHPGTSSTNPSSVHPVDVINVTSPVATIENQTTLMNQASAEVDDKDTSTIVSPPGSVQVDPASPSSSTTSSSSSRPPFMEPLPSFGNDYLAPVSFNPSDENGDLSDECSGVAPMMSLEGPASFEQFEAPPSPDATKFFQDGLCTKLSSVTLASSTTYSSAEVGIKGLPSQEIEEAPVERTPSLEEGAKEEDEQVVVDSMCSFKDGKRALGDSLCFSDTEHTKQEFKAVPETFSDFEPCDFDESSDDDSNSEFHQDIYFSPSDEDWPKRSKGNRQMKQQEDTYGHQYLDTQSLPRFQGSRPNNKDFGSSKSLSRSFLATNDDDNVPFRLVDAAMVSGTMMESPTTDVPTNTCLSEHFTVMSRKGSKSMNRITAKETSCRTGTMHSSNLSLHEMTLTSGALNSICGKSTDQYARKTSLEMFLEQGGTPSSSEKGETISSWSEDSGKPSVAPDAVDSKLLKAFSLDSIESPTIFPSPTAGTRYLQSHSLDAGEHVSFLRKEALTTIHESRQSSGMPAMRQFGVEPRQNCSPHRGETPMKVVGLASTNLSNPLQRDQQVSNNGPPNEQAARSGNSSRQNRSLQDQKTAVKVVGVANKKVNTPLNANSTPLNHGPQEEETSSSNISPSKRASKAFSSMIERFGGTGNSSVGGCRRAQRKTRIERQKEALEQQWATDRQVKHVKKTKWQVGTPGVYKKKVFLDYENK